LLDTDGPLYAILAHQDDILHNGNVYSSTNYKKVKTDKAGGNSLIV